MEVFTIIWDLLFGTFIRIHNFVETWIQNAHEFGFTISKGSLIATTFWMVLLCASAMTAMTIAEVKFRNRLLHGALGFICPVIYPILLHFIIPAGAGAKDDDKYDEEQKTQKTAPGNVIPESDLKAFSKNSEDDEVIPAGDVMDQAYFTRIAKDETGQLRGPFILELDDDQILEIECIVEALPPTVAVKIGHDENARTIRLPYSKIKNCMTKGDWLAEADMPEDEEHEDENIHEEEHLEVEEE